MAKDEETIANLVALLRGAGLCDERLAADTIKKQTRIAELLRRARLNG